MSYSPIGDHLARSLASTFSCNFRDSVLEKTTSRQLREGRAGGRHVSSPQRPMFIPYFRFKPPRVCWPPFGRSHAEPASAHSAFALLTGVLQPLTSAEGSPRRSSLGLMVSCRSSSALR